MRKGILAVLAVFLLLASFSAAQMAADKEKPNAAFQQADAAGKAIGLKADKAQCLCSADTLAKIEQIKKLLAELEQSCYQQSTPVPEPQELAAVSCVGKCLAEQKESYCAPTCAAQEDKEACMAECVTAMKQKCENSCNLPQAEQKPSAVPEPDALSKCAGACEDDYAACKKSCFSAAGNDPEKLKQAEECAMSQCVPAREQCVKSCGNQYGKKETFVQKLVNVFKAKLHKSAKWECYDGTVGESWETCKPVEDFQARAKEACDGKCSAATNKCGVNSFYVYGEC